MISRKVWPVFLPVFVKTVETHSFVRTVRRNVSRINPRFFFSIEIERKYSVFDARDCRRINFFFNNSFVPRCAPTVWDHEQGSQAAFFAACDHPPEVAEEMDTLTGETGQRRFA